MYSQNNEEEIILKYFGDFVGTFCDIGANDGKTFSNTACLVELGWSGVMVEPHQSAYEACKLRYSDNPKIIVINCAIGPKTEIIDFHMGSDSLLSTAVVEHMRHWPDTHFTRGNAKQYKWKDFCDKCSYDFISVDAEGMDWEILQQIDLSQTRLLCIEHGDALKQIKEYCHTFGMKAIHTTAQNTLFAK